MSKILVSTTAPMVILRRCGGGRRRRPRRAGQQVTIKRDSELVPEEVAKKSGMKLNQPHQSRNLEELADYDASSSARPRASAHVRADAQLPRPDWRPLDERRAGGKVGSVFASTATSMAARKRQSPRSHDLAAPGHDNRRLALCLPRTDEYGRDNRRLALRRQHPGQDATARASRAPTKLDGARYQGKHVAQYCRKAGRRSLTAWGQATAGLAGRSARCPHICSLRPGSLL